MFHSQNINKLLLFHKNGHYYCINLSQFFFLHNVFVGLRHSMLNPLHRLSRSESRNNENIILSTQISSFIIQRKEANIAHTAQPHRFDKPGHSTDSPSLSMIILVYEWKFEENVRYMRRRNSLEYAMTIGYTHLISTSIDITYHFANILFPNVAYFEFCSRNLGMCLHIPHSNVAIRTSILYKRLHNKRCLYTYNDQNFLV